MAEQESKHPNSVYSDAFTSFAQQSFPVGQSSGPSQGMSFTAVQSLVGSYVHAASGAPMAEFGMHPRKASSAPHPLGPQHAESESPPGVFSVGAWHSGANAVPGSCGGTHLSTPGIWSPQPPSS